MWEIVLTLFVALSLYWWEKRITTYRNSVAEQFKFLFDRIAKLEFSFAESKTEIVPDSDMHKRGYDVASGNWHKQHRSKHDKA